VVDFNVGRVVPAILRGAAAKKGKLSPEGGVYPRDAIQELPDPDAQQAAAGPTTTGRGHGTTRRRRERLWR
jgi:hypothetical protein